MVSRAHDSLSWSLFKSVEGTYSSREAGASRQRPTKITAHREAFTGSTATGPRCRPTHSPLTEHLPCARRDPPGVTAPQEPGQLGFHPNCAGEAGVGDKVGELFRVIHLPFVTTNAWTFQNPVSPEISSEGNYPTWSNSFLGERVSWRRSLDLITSHLRRWQGLPNLGGSLGRLE